jgi:glycosyltransferase involved in cell wall biosynthesis
MSGNYPEAMDENTHLVSVIIPVYNGASFLVGAIENVLAQMYQPY